MVGSSENDSSGGIPGDYGFLLLGAIVTFVYQLFFFTIAATLKFDKVTDLAGGSNFVLLSILTWALGNNSTPRHTAVNILVIGWGVRLAGYLFLRIMTIGEDKRFDKMRENPLEFAVFWIFQFFWVWVVMFPVMSLNDTRHVPDLNYSDIIGIVLAAGGLLIEAIADHTKFTFKNNKERVGNPWCDVGIWKYSRHPNYFGELAFWWGIFIVCSRIMIQQTESSATDGGSDSSGDYNPNYAKFYGVLSPLFITAILFGLSGLPLLEKSSNGRYGGNSAYLAYRSNTSPLIPMPNFLYAALPRAIKWCFFEYYMYEAGLARPDGPTVNDSINVA